MSALHVKLYIFLESFGLPRLQFVPAHGGEDEVVGRQLSEGDIGAIDADHPPEEGTAGPVEPIPGPGGPEAVAAHPDFVHLAVHDVSHVEEIVRVEALFTEVLVAAFGGEQGVAPGLPESVLGIFGGQPDHVFEFHGFSLIIEFWNRRKSLKCVIFSITIFPMIVCHS
jgi:hypothetical protein